MLGNKLAAITALARAATAASLTQVTSFGNNPTGARMFIYVPDVLADSPPLVVAIHWCHGSADAYFTDTDWKTYSDSKGFIVAYPESPNSDGCWDVSSYETLTHNGGGDSAAIASMITYAQSKYHIPRNRTFVTGTSSRGMMTNVMAAVYPNLFSAGAPYSGVAAGCFMSNTGMVDFWNATCATGMVVASSTYWAAVVKAMGGSAPYPKMQIWHGSTDGLLLPQNYNETIKEWVGVFGLSETPTSTAANTAAYVFQAKYFTYNYGTLVQGIYAVGVGHTVPEHVPQSLKWFGIE